MELTGIEELYARVHHRLWSSLLALAADENIASDAEAEAFAQLMRRGNAVRNPEAWLWKSSFRIAAGMMSKQRRERARVEVQSEYRDDPGLAEFLAMLGGLSAQQKACVVLRYVAQLDNAAISSALGTSEQVVRVQLYRAHRSLRQSPHLRGEVD